MENNIVPIFIACLYLSLTLIVTCLCVKIKISYCPYAGSMDDDPEEIGGF